MSARSRRLVAPSVDGRRLGGGRKLRDLLSDLSRCRKQVDYQTVVDIEGALVLGPVPHVVTLRENAPDVWPQTKRVRQAPERRYSVSRANRDEQGRQAQRCAALYARSNRLSRDMDVFSASFSLTRPDRTDRELLRVRRLRCVDVPGTDKMFKRRWGGHLRHQSPRSWAAAELAARTHSPGVGTFRRTPPPCRPLD